MLIVNYCRNPTPDTKETIWCYTTDATDVDKDGLNGKYRWEYCDPIKYGQLVENAKIYIGETIGEKETLCGAMPASVEYSKFYNFECQLVGDYIKIVTGRPDGNLSFAHVKVIADDKKDLIMIRNPQLTSGYSKEWNYKDTRWTKNNVEEL